MKKQKYNDKRIIYIYFRKYDINITAEQILTCYYCQNKFYKKEKIVRYIEFL